MILLNLHAGIWQKFTSIKLPLIYQLLILMRLESLNKLSIKQVLNRLNDKDLEIINNRVFKVLKIDNRLSVILLSYYVDCPWQIYVAKS